MKKLWSAYGIWRHGKRRQEIQDQKKYWRTLFNAESEKSFWEITNSEHQQIVQLRFVPNDDYSSSDIRIQMTAEQFEDLLDLCNRLKTTPTE